MRKTSFYYLQILLIKYWGLAAVLRKRLLKLKFKVRLPEKKPPFRLTNNGFTYTVYLHVSRKLIYKYNQKCKRLRCLYKERLAFLKKLALLQAKREREILKENYRYYLMTGKIRGFDDIGYNYNEDRPQITLGFIIKLVIVCVLSVYGFLYILGYIARPDNPFIIIEDICAHLGLYRLHCSFRCNLFLFKCVLKCLFEALYVRLPFTLLVAYVLFIMALFLVMTYFRIYEPVFENDLEYTIKFYQRVIEVYAILIFEALISFMFPYLYEYYWTGSYSDYSLIKEIPYDILTIIGWICQIRWDLLEFVVL
jgi:hypothetical protein